MTSKEALEELQCVLVSNQATKRYSDIFEENLLRPIKKDLDLLEEYRKIEEEIGIDLINAVELCKQVNSKKVVYTKERWGIDTIKILDELDIELFNHRLYSNSKGIYVSLDLYEYGKIWALTKEELESED